MFIYQFINVLFYNKNWRSQMGKYLNNRQNRRPKRQSVLRQTINFVGKKAKLIFLVLLLIFFFRVPNIQAQSAGGGWLIDTTIIPIIN